MQTFRSKYFWLPFLITTIAFGAFFAWELGFFVRTLPSFPRPEPTEGEELFTAALIFLLALNAGLFNWQRKFGSCPIGTRHATGVGGAVGAFALLCPVCLLIPFSLFGLSISLAIFTPYIPLLRIIALLILAVSTMLLWPKKGPQRATAK